MNNQSLVARSLAAVWHPCTQMKHHEQFPLVPIVRGEGVWLIDAEGKRYLDAVSSWWVNLFGHANPRINAALTDQLNQLAHMMLAGFTHTPAIELAERLGELTGLGHVFYASDGASAVEIALKMSFHYWRNVGKPDKTKFVSLAGSYHGETLGALSVTDVAIFRDAYAPLLAHNLIAPFPESPISAPLSGDSPTAIQALEKLFSARHAEIAALIIEPMVQGAAGMRMMSADYLGAARALCTRYGIHFIADEIMTGFGRTGTLFACEHAQVRPDILCLSKGITGGYLPLSCVLTTDDIFAAFYDDVAARGFLHSHSYTGNALACRAALATLDIFETDHVIEANREKAARFSICAEKLRLHPGVKNFRHLGMIWAFEVQSGVENNVPQFARQFFSRALAHGILLRPIGNTVYFMPPYVITEAEFAHLVDVTCVVMAEIASQ